MRTNLIASSLTLFFLLSFGAGAQTPPPAGDPSQTQPWQVQTVPARTAEGGKTVTLTIATRAPLDTPPRQVLLFLSPYPVALVKVDHGSTALTLNVPWVTASAQLNQRGIAVAFVDAPTDARPGGLALRATSEIADDLRVAVQSLKQQFPGVPIHLAGFFIGVGPLIEAADSVKDLGRIVIASGDFRDSRNTDWSGLKSPVLLLHAPSAQCDNAPFIEAEHVAHMNHFALVRVGYAKLDPKPGCGRTSQHIFTNLEAELADTVAQWLGGAEPPASIGYPTPRIAWREQVVNYTVPSMFGSNRLEMTMLLPGGSAPYPVVVFNHGDVEADTTYARFKRRYVDMGVAREFLRLGWAVVFPARPGVGLSEGTYRMGFSADDADATYTAKVHAKGILPVFEALKDHPLLDTRRVVVSGQSAGGYAAMYLASLNLPGVIGAIDFSGGRTDKTLDRNAANTNSMMVRGFAEFGQTTKVPTLWVFAENDSRYTANTIRASHKAFVDAGGKATLSLSPPIEGDGHFIFQKPELWRAVLREYLAPLQGATGAP